MTSLDLFVADVVQRHRVCNVEAALLLLLECNIRRRLVNTDAEALEFRLNDTLVRQGLVDVEDDEDEMARLRHCDNLTTTSTTVLGTLDDTW
ncbi:hypothetical protein HYQ46_000636 [Verticillium longisporum]|nr:hypothetical protein HYQ46_000636 [Verticillium longisporum]